ncbi:hypothetical protein TNCV_3702221 [Trichonephila clavipes]|nr:hypothetical protein TNCV_3702221 [Trichonephila clavipes]
MHQRSSVGDGRFIPTSSDVTNQWPGLVSRRCCMSSSPVLQKTRNVGEAMHEKPIDAQTFSCWCGVEVRKGGASSDVVLVT